MNVPKIKSKDEAVRQITKCADVLKKLMKEKYGEDFNGKQIGRGELKNILGRQSERFKDVVMCCVKKFNITQFFDSEGEIKIVVLDVKKPLFQIFVVRHEE